MASPEPTTEPAALGWPVTGPVTQEYGHNGHPGIDIGVGTGTPVAAAAAGTVVTAADNGDGYGICAVVAHPGGLFTRYGHLSRLMVRQGQAVAAGSVLGLSGSTGYSTGPHLHWEVRTGGPWGPTHNPRDYVGQGQPNGSAALGPAVPAGDLADTSTDPGALAGLVSLGQALGDGRTWVRVLEVVAGLGLVVAGVLLITRDTWAPLAKDAAIAAVAA